MKNLVALLFAYSLLLNSYAQSNSSWQEVISEVKYVASTTKADAGFSHDKDRVLITARLPKNAIGYVIKITVDEKANNNTSLISSLGSITSPEVGLIAGLVTKGDGNQCDVFTFNNEDDARNFQNKQPRFGHCNSYTQIASISKYETTCLDMIYLGLRNNNMMSGLNVKVEVAAFIDKSLSVNSQKESFRTYINELKEKRDYDGIISFCTRELQNGNENAEVYDNIGWYCLVTKQFTKAKHYLETASQKYPDNLYIQCKYAHALLLTNNYDEAIKVYKTHLEENINAKLSWKQVISSEIEKFQKLDIKNEHFAEIVDLMR